MEAPAAPGLAVDMAVGVGYSAEVLSYQHFDASYGLKNGVQSVLLPLEYSGSSSLRVKSAELGVELWLVHLMSMLSCP